MVPLGSPIAQGLVHSAIPSAGARMFDSAFAEDAAGRFSEERSARLIEGVRVERVAELEL